MESRCEDYSNLETLNRYVLNSRCGNPSNGTQFDSSSVILVRISMPTMRSRRVERRERGVLLPEMAAWANSWYPTVDSGDPILWLKGCRS